MEAGLPVASAEDAYGRLFLSNYRSATLSLSVGLLQGWSMDDDVRSGLRCVRGLGMPPLDLQPALPAADRAPAGAGDREEPAEVGGRSSPSSSPASEAVV
mmetsp:Transcript_92853/g.259434  ORF Transcript_92853/g.259434 Transcript_92853/m.259434 type:complete len:100 (-) Transcript_92853:3-302(-)